MSHRFPTGPASIADVVALLVSEDARWITGQNVRANCGLIRPERAPSVLPGGGRGSGQENRLSYANLSS
jgi:hypothetical protein